MLSLHFIDDSLFMSINIPETLRKVEAFRSLSNDSAARLSRAITIESYDEGAHIVRKGEAGDCMYVIQEGEVRIPIEDDRGRRRFVAELKKGGVFGEMALMTDEPRSADVIASRPCTLLVLSRSTVDELLSQFPDVASFMTTILGQRLMEIGGIRKVGKYQLTGEIGRGGMAIIYEGIHPQLSRRVAIKMLSHTLVYRRHFAERFRNEARVIASLRHPNIVDVYDTEQSYATFFIIMEKLQGQDVEQILDETGRMHPDETRRVLQDVASALAYAHEHSIIHRDVKPSNIVIGPEGAVKLTDFGIAAVDGVEDSMTRDEGIYLGTPIYSSPEHAMGESVDPRSDIYALGIVAYEMLTGQAPFDMDDPQQILLAHVHEPVPNPRLIHDDIPQDLVEFIQRACAKDPADRFQNCHEIVDFFESYRRRNTIPYQVRVKTLTFVYSPDQEQEVQRLTDTVEALADPIPGVLIKTK